MTLPDHSGGMIVLAAGYRKSGRFGRYLKNRVGHITVQFIFMTGANHIKSVGYLKIGFNIHDFGYWFITGSEKLVLY